MSDGPVNETAEQAVLGAILLDPEQMKALSGLLRAEMFSTSNNRSIFECFLELFLERRTIDIVTVADRLQQKSMLESIGGISKLTTLMEIVPSSAGILEYAEIVRRDYFTRQMILTSKKIEERLRGDPAANVDEIVQEAAKVLKELSSEARPVNTSLKGVISTTVERISLNADLIPLGHRRMDIHMGGLLRREPVIVGARTSNLKTTFCADRIPYWLEKGYRVQVFSLEVPGDMYMRKIICNIGKIDFNALRRYALTRPELERFLARCNEIYANFDTKLSIMDFSDGVKDPLVLERAVRSFKPDIFIVDFIALMKTTHPQYRRIEVGENVEFLKELGINMNAVPIIVCQINRQAMKVQSKSGDTPMPFPKLEDLKETGDIEEKATEAFLLYYHYATTKDIEHVHRLRVELAKSRYGPLGVIHLHYNPSFCRLTDLGYESFNAEGERE